ncbi:MAG: translation initiation factor IF-2 [Alphaproteobacteria bacterium]|nr:translation initiation factor IF-2 [Alphaproteobacteria bacterium]
MSESKTQESKLSLNKPGRLELKKTVETGQVRQSFSHGRTKAVTVEVKRKRTFERGTTGGMQEVKANAEAQAFKDGGAGGGAQASLTEDERATRLRAVHGAAEDAEKRKLEDAERQRQEEEAKKQKAEEEARRAEEEARRKADEETRRQTEAEETPAAAKDPAEVEAALERTRSAPARKAATPSDEEEAVRGRRSVGKADPKRTQTLRARQEPRRRSSKLTITQALESEDGTLERARSIASLKRAREREKQRARQLAGELDSANIVRDVVIPETITVADLANRMAVRGTDVIKTLMKSGVMATTNQIIDADTAELVVAEFGHRVRRVSESDVEIGLDGTPDQEESLVSRAPIVTVMGHVDHGKTSLLDALRKTDVAAGEAGGITQHIGAYQVRLSSGAEITFLDTPGHEAFTSMRARGASVTDLVVLVIAAEDSVQPQTAEAISHAKAAEVPIIVAINKIDRPDADPNRIRNELLSHEIVVESLGGDVQDVEISATEGTNLDKLEEAIILQAELMELSANPDRPGQGAVVEARLERGRGAVATLLVQRGTLKIGDIFVAGAEWGRVRALINDRGENIKEAGPSIPVEILGLQGAPGAGDDFAVVEDEARAREIAEYRKRKARNTQIAAGARGTLEQLFDQIKEGEAATATVLLKGDVQGSVEAINAALQKMGTDEVEFSILHSGVGGITESDIGLAAASQAVILGFNVRANPQAREMAKREGVDIRYYSIIYDLIDDMKQLLGGLLAPEIRQNFIGYADVREVFNITKVGKVAGCYVTEGVIRRGTKCRLLRDQVVVFDGNLKTLRRFKDDVREVQNNFECGIAFENYHDIRQGDVIECYEVQEVKREL